MKTEINKHDIVRVNFINAQFTLCEKAIVLYIPSAPGDSWILKDFYTNEIYYVSEGCTITLLNSKS